MGDDDIFLLNIVLKIRTKQIGSTQVTGSFFISANEIRVSREGFFCTGTETHAFVWIFGSFLISANEIRVSREGFFCSGTETHGRVGREMDVRTESLFCT